jgi:hypothetical protein
MKGYLVHGGKKLVLSKLDALPHPYQVNTTKYGLPLMTSY